MFKRFDGWTALCFAAAAGSHTAVDAILSDKRVVTASFLHANASVRARCFIRTLLGLQFRYSSCSSATRAAVPLLELQCLV